MKPLGLLALALAAFLARPEAAHAGAGTDDEAAARPTLALALGGGGSRGLAHIGVLRWLDEHRIPVDAIAGTSMGGLIGGAYASGLGPDELEAWIDGVDFVRLFDWNGPYAPRPYRDKVTTRALPGPVDTGLFGGLPLGVNDGHVVERLLARLTFPVSDREDFDDLPTPYRAVAVDFVDARIVTIGNGSLAQAMRATMSLPGFFEPVARDGDLLIDGGAMRTLPADAARALGIDEVLAVDVSPSLKDVDDVRGFPDVFLASLTAQVRVNIDAALEDGDRVVRPDVDGFEPGDFDRAATLIARGYAAMDSADVDLSHLVLDDADYAAWKASRAARRPSLDDFVPAFVEVDADDPADRRSVGDAMQDFVDRPLDLDALDAAMDRLAATDRFVAARYERATRDGRPGLRVVTRADARRGALETGLRLHATDVDDADLGLHARLTLHDVLVRDGEWQSDFLVGTRLELRSELYVPLAGPLFVAVDGGYAQRERAVFDRGGRIGSFERHHLEGGVDLGLGHLWTHHELRVGIRAHGTWRDDPVGLTALPDEDGLTARARWGFDTTDHVSLPRHGVRGELIARRGFERSGTDASVDQAVGRVAGWLPVGRHAIVARAEAGATFDRNAPFGDRFTLGGPFRMSALPEERLVGSNFEYASIGWQHVLGSPNNFLTGALLFAYETGAVHGFDAAATFEHVGSINLLVDTPVGNFMTGIAAGDDGARGYLTFGIVPY